jgi:hypothetical protein
MLEDLKPLLAEHSAMSPSRMWRKPTGSAEVLSSHQSQKLLMLCEFCDASFTSSGGLSLHKATVHMNRKFSCSLCEKSFTRKENLTNHMVSQHLGVSLDASKQ